MPLSDLAVFDEYLYTTQNEILRQQFELFNASAEGALVLTLGENQGDFTNEAFYKRVSGGIYRRRNAYGSGSIASRILEHGEDVSVKIAAGTFELKMPKSQFRWIQRNPAEAGVVYGQQLAAETMADYLNGALGCISIAMSNVPSLELDVSEDGDANSANKMSFVNQNRAASRRGDRSNDIAVWFMHSTPMHGLYDQNLTNTERLFEFGSVNVIRNPFGKLMVMTDSPNLIDTTDVEVDYISLGLTPGSAIIQENNDFDANEESRNGEENIDRSYQAEWSYTMSIKGFAWNKSSGGASPLDAALFSAGNWNRILSDDKDLPGVVLRTRG